MEVSLLSEREAKKFKDEMKVMVIFINILYDGKDQDVVLHARILHMTISIQLIKGSRNNNSPVTFKLGS